MVSAPDIVATKGGSLAFPREARSSQRDCVVSAAASHNQPQDSQADSGAARSLKIPRWKRIFDVTCVALSLPIWLPLMVLVMVWITLVSPGPLIYRQERIGFRGKRFVMFKFRSMRVDIDTGAHEGYLQTLMESDRPMVKLDAAGDPRMIRWGRLLRASALDELPQLFNVLRGEMTLVGPRPCTPHEFERYQPSQYERFNAPPGLTGYWQVNGKNKTTFSQMIAMDIHYARHMSPWMDIAIVMKTVPALIEQIIEIITLKLESVTKDAPADPDNLVIYLPPNNNSYPQN